MKRAAATFDSLVRRRYQQSGMPPIESGKPRTESQAAQKLFAAITNECALSSGSFRVTPAIAESLQARADEVPALARDLIGRRLVDKDVHAQFLTGSDRASRALRCLAGDPAGSDLHRHFLPAVLGLPQAAVLSTASLDAGVAADLAKQMYNGLPGAGFAVRAKPIDHAHQSMAAAVSAGLLSQEMGRAIVAEFTKLVPDGVGLDAGMPVDRVEGRIPRYADLTTPPILVNNHLTPQRETTARTVEGAPAEHRSHHSRFFGAMRRITHLPLHLHLHVPRGKDRTESRVPSGAQTGPHSAQLAEQIREARQMRLGGPLDARVVAGFDLVDRQESDDGSAISATSMTAARQAAWQL